ncbi:unnamed protein product [Dicrocoelium dendriticum]|nr:unnamed protein product [Dicrocoelium dendriticum]
MRTQEPSKVVKLSLADSSVSTAAISQPRQSEEITIFKSALTEENEARRHSAQSGSGNEKRKELPQRPVLGGYPLLSGRPSLPVGYSGSQTESSNSSSSSVGEKHHFDTFMAQGKDTKVLAAEPVKLGREPVVVRCQTCQQRTMTVTTFHIGVITWLSAVLIFLCGGILGCFLIPFYTDCCKDVKHTCPVCDTEIGLVKVI